MVETIVPVVHGTRISYYRSVALHALGAALAGGAAGALLGAAGMALRAPWGVSGIVLVAAIAGIYLLREALGLPVPLPQRRAQVPHWWRTFYSPSVAALLYGLGLGPGFFTYLSFGTYAAVAAGAVATGRPAAGALLGAAFGAARGLSVLVSAGTRDPHEAGIVADRLAALAATGLPRGVNAVTLSGIAAAALWTAA